MPRFRTDLGLINPYVPGKPIEEVARELGLDPNHIVKLASNEAPEGPIPAAVSVIRSFASNVHRYPDTGAFELVRALSQSLDVPPESLLVGSGSTSLIGLMALAVGGPETTAVFAWPSFIMYRISTHVAMSSPIEVPLDSDLRHDLSGLRDAIESTTSVVYLCNPNNPTGTIVDSGDIETFIRSIPESIAVVVDEAYHDYVTADSYHSAISLARELPNVVVLRTFSKIYGLAGLRIGYAIGHPGTISVLRKLQAPFSVNQLAQLAAMAALGDREELGKRREANASGRLYLWKSITELGYRTVESEANFVYMEIDGNARRSANDFMAHGVIVRPIGESALRITVGSEAENQRFVEALHQLT